jgi:hypothetical protein
MVKINMPILVGRKALFRCQISSQISLKKEDSPSHQNAGVLNVDKKSKTNCTV